MENGEEIVNRHKNTVNNYVEEYGVMERDSRFILSLGVDDVGFASVLDYSSPKSCEITKFLPDEKFMLVHILFVYVQP